MFVFLLAETVSWHNRHCGLPCLKMNAYSRVHSSWNYLVDSFLFRLLCKVPIVTLEMVRFVKDVIATLTALIGLIADDTFN